jgi:rhodanese-related sulfurtransferase
VLFKTVFPQDLCAAFEKNPNFLLLDVRSPGEFADTSSLTGLNIGHLDGAVNMEVSQISKRLREIAAYKNEPVFVYCSYSQRSRRASKMLADSGFTNVNNINGGMTAIHLLNTLQKGCLDYMIKSSNKYAVVSAPDLCRKLSEKFNSIYLLDVRPDSAWDHIATNPKFNAFGYLKGSKHIALVDLKNKLSQLPKGKEIVVTDLSGADAAIAAKTLKDAGFDKVYALIEGIDRWNSSDKKDWGCAKDIYVPSVNYTIMSSGEFSRFFPSAKDVLLLDVRPAEEFLNKHADGFRNIGHLKNAVNIPLAEINNRLSDIEKYKSSPIVVYAFSSGSTETYATANTLVQNGFKQVYVLAGGLFNVRCTASNVAGMYFMHDWVEGVPDENK